jgi:PAS domain S-box-containing protein
MSETESELETLRNLLLSFSTFQSRFTEVHKAETVDEVFQLTAEIFMETLDVSALRCLAHESVDGQYEEKFFKSKPNMDFEGIENDNDLIDWAVDNKNVMLFPIEDQKLLDQGLQTLVILPISGEEGHGILLMWVSFGEKTSTKFFSDLLQNNAREIASLADTKQLLARVHNLHDLMDNVVESVPLGILAIDKDDRILTCNGNMEILFGLKSHLMLEQRYQTVFPDEVADFFSAIVIQTLNGHASEDHELKFKDSIIGVSTSLLQDWQNNLQGLVFICRDLSLSLEVQRLRELDNMKSEFIHTVSHELKTPLTAIMAGSEYLISLKEGIGDEVSGIIDIIYDSGKRLKTLITDLLDLSRLESNKITVEPQVCDITPLINSSMDMVGNNNSHISWRFDQKDDLCEVMADPLKIKQVFDNLISNAAKYSPGGGEITISLKKQGPEVLFRVADQGIGIPKDQCPLVWDKFYRVDSSTTAEIEGTGLGLPIVKLIVELHNGEIFLESEMGEGSVFGFNIPNQLEAV